jgi:hypothetical protein
MDTALLRVSFQLLTDAQLMGYLATAGDRLPRGLVDEALRRGESLIAPLSELCRDDQAWRQTGASYWAPIHATYLLGAMESPGALPGLLAALRWSVRYDVDWVHDLLPSIFGPLGRAAVPPLRQRAFDVEGRDDDRTAAVRCLAGVAAHHPVLQGEILDSLKELADYAGEPERVRLAAAEVLTAFVRPGDRATAASAAIRGRWSDLPAFFDLEDVEEAWASGKQRLAPYRRDWLEFYDEREVESRQRRWREEAEDARWSRGVLLGELWVEEQCRRFLTRYEFTLGDLDDLERGDACWVAESLVEYLVWYENVAPWRLSRATAFAFLMDVFARRVALDHAGRIEAVPGELLRFARFCGDLGLVGPADLDGVESAVAEEEECFLAAALDPERRAVAREVLARLVAKGIDPREPEEAVRPESPLPPSRERPTARRRRTA